MVRRSAEGAATGGDSILMQPSRIARALALTGLAAGFFAFSWILRYNEPEGSFAGLLDDHYFYVVRGWQMLYGEWPDRDFVDIGAPLMFVLSAAAQWLGGRGTWPEIVLCVTMLSAAAALSFYAAARASGSLAAASAATLFHVTLAPRFYNYPKLIAYAMAVPATWALLDRATWPRRALVAAVLVVALLLRHDHGFFIGVFVAATVVLSGWSWAEKRRELVRVALLALAFVTPYLVYLQANGGIVPHFVTANAWSVRDRGRAPLRLPAFADAAGLPAFVDANLVPYLFYLFMVMPVAAAALLWWSRDAWRPDWPHARARLAGVAVLACLLNVGFLRGALAARLADVLVPHTILIAWLLVVAVAIGRRGVVTSAAGPARVQAAARVAVPVLVAGALALPAIPLARELRSRLERSRVWLDPGETVGRMQEITARFQATWPLERWASPTSNASMALVFYFDACTAPTDRVFVSAYMPQVPALARRAFAGGHPDLRPGFFATEHDQRLFLERIRRQPVPVLIVPPADEYEQFARHFPLVHEHFAAEYDVVGDRELGDRTHVGVRVRRGAAARSRYEPLDLPCFR